MTMFPGRKIPKSEPRIKRQMVLNVKAVIKSASEQLSRFNRKEKRLPA